VRRQRITEGNARVARLMSHAMLLESLDTGCVWSVARGLARNVEACKRHLTDADGPRRNDLDGRGTLSEEALAEFARFFLSACINQITFMESLVKAERLRARIVLWAEEEERLRALPPKSASILEAVLYRREVLRGDAAGVVGASERHARRIVSALIERGVLTADSARRCVLFFRRHWLLAGCPDCSRKSPVRKWARRMLSFRSAHNQRNLRGMNNHGRPCSRATSAQKAKKATNRQQE